jgi:hypothetical protein
MPAVAAGRVCADAGASKCNCTASVYFLNAKYRPVLSQLRIGRGLDAFIQIVDGRGLLVAQMLEQDIAKFAARPAAERVQDGLVFAHRFAPAVSLPGKIGRVTHPANSSGEVRVSLSSVALREASTIF